MATSRLQSVINTIIEELQQISTANGYNTDPYQVIHTVRHPNDVMDFPEIGVEVSDETVIPDSSPWNLWHSKISIMIVAAIKANTDTGDAATNLENAAEDIRHDLKKVVAVIFTKYLVATDHWWCIDPSQKSIEIGTLGGEGIKENVTMMAVAFDALLRHQDSSFAGIRDYTFASTEVTFAETEPKKFDKDDTLWLSS